MWFISGQFAVSVVKSKFYVGGLRAGSGFLINLGGYSMKRRVLSLMITLALCLNLCPVWVLAAGEGGPCPHHPAHTDECGYVPPTLEQECIHNHDDSCYTTEIASMSIRPSATPFRRTVPKGADRFYARMCAGRTAAVWQRSCPAPMNMTPPAAMPRKLPARRACLSAGSAPSRS